MVTTLATLLTGRDGFELVRDQLALLIFDNAAAQFALAAGEAEPNDWRLDVYTERATPWEAWLRDPTLSVPIVNVSFESAELVPEKSVLHGCQTYDGLFHVDIFGRGVAEDDGAGGHKPGDQSAIDAAFRAARLCRRFVMASENLYLQLRRDSVGPTGPAVGKRVVSSLVSLGLSETGDEALRVAGFRLIVRAEYREDSPQGDESEELEYVAVDINRNSDGKLIGEADFDYTV